MSCVRDSYVGLRNLGCICYMNASMQQFFMVPGFRRQVLAFQDKSPDPKESLMYQLQRMFTYLQESEQQAYDPSGYCHAFKDWEGNPTNTAVQKDASEYLTMLFQRLESLTMGTAQADMLRTYFGGIMSSELIADEGRRYSERPEPFTFITVPVLNMGTLEVRGGGVHGGAGMVWCKLTRASRCVHVPVSVPLCSPQRGLKELVKGETVSYKWEDAGGDESKTPKELSTTKRASFKQLPRHLLIHLKRFDFNYTTMEQRKLNDRFEFPDLLDMRPYTLEGRPDPAPGAEERGQTRVADADISDDAYMYELSGIVIHSGSAQSGHYYSYIRSRDREGRPWFVFNDAHVAPFDPARIPEEAFGGPYDTGYSSAAASSAAAVNPFAGYDLLGVRCQVAAGTVASGVCGGSHTVFSVAAAWLSCMGVWVCGCVGVWTVRGRPRRRRYAL